MTKAIDVYNMRIRQSFSLIIMAAVLAACSQQSDKESSDNSTLTSIDQRPKFQRPMGPYGLPYRVGNLDGRPVNLGEEARFLEYDDAPWSDPKALKEHPSSSHTYDSAVAVFGVDMRYTDGIPLIRYYKAPQYAAEQYKIQINQPNHQWVHLTVLAASSFQLPREGADKIDRWARIYIERKPRRSETVGLLNYYNVYIKTDELAYGLERYVPHPKWIREAGYENTPDVYVHKNTTGKIDTFIQCHNIDVPLARNCYQDFLLDPALKVQVTAKFQRVHLQDWQLIQQQAKTLLNSFFVQP